MRDTLLEHLIGRWSVSRRIGNQSTATSAEADWVLSHQFIRLHYQDANASAAPYEAMVFIGYDNAGKRYVAHWLDTFGGRWSETLGYGRAVPNGIRFLFAYPDGQFVNTLTYDATSGGWSSLMRRKTASGAWTTFGEEHFVRVAPGSR